MQRVALMCVLLLFCSILTACMTDTDEYEGAYTYTEISEEVETVSNSSSDSHKFMYASPIYFNLIATCIYDQWNLEELTDLSTDYAGLNLSLHASKTIDDITMDLYYYGFDQTRYAKDMYNALVEPRLYDVECLEMQTIANSLHEDVQSENGIITSYNYFRVDGTHVVWGTCGTENQGELTETIKNFVDISIDPVLMDSTAETTFKFDKVFSHESVMNTLEAANFTFEQTGSTTYTIGSSINTAVGSLRKSKSTVNSVCNFVNTAIALQKQGYTVAQCTITSNVLTYRCENLSTQKYCYCLVFDDNEFFLENSVSSFKADIAIIERLWNK